VFYHKLARQRRISIQRHRRRAIELCVRKAADGGRCGLVVALQQLERFNNSSASALLTATCSVACWAFILCTSSQLTPATDLPDATVCASCTSSGYTLAT